ncbi:hypothetical protein [Lysobacter silvisoli]|nr:hypothetical protein [Lysobacter silvisoli]
MTYLYVQEITDKKVGKNLNEPEVAIQVLRTIQTIAEATEPVDGDQVKQWLGLLRDNEILAQKWKTSAHGIEIYPSGKRSEDRLGIVVNNGVVTVVNAWISEH